MQGHGRRMADDVRALVPTPTPAPNLALMPAPSAASGSTPDLIMQGVPGGQADSLMLTEKGQLESTGDSADSSSTLGGSRAMRRGLVVDGHAPLAAPSASVVSRPASDSAASTRSAARSEPYGAKPGAVRTQDDIDAEFERGMAKIKADREALDARLAAIHSGGGSSSSSASAVTNDEAQSIGNRLSRDRMRQADKEAGWSDSYLSAMDERAAAMSRGSGNVMPAATKAALESLRPPTLSLAPAPVQQGAHERQLAMVDMGQGQYEAPDPFISGEKRPLPGGPTGKAMEPVDSRYVGIERDEQVNRRPPPPDPSAGAA
jgi:hypothetical protein